MNTIRTWIENPKLRRQALMIASGLLISAAFVVDGLVGWHAGYTLMMTAAALLAGSDIAVRAWNSLHNRHISIELLVTIATIGALVIGEVWEAAAVTFLFIFGAYLEARTLSHTRQVLQGLLDLVPTTAIVWRDGKQIEVLPHEVGFGETVMIKPGGKVPVDGEVIDGRSAVDESMITGESIPEEKNVGSPVYAGTVNQDGLLRVRATGIGADTTLARIVQRVEEAQEEKAPTQRFIERFAQYYTPFIIGLSLVVYVISRDLDLALTLLVIGCPGALVISTPISVVAGIGRAAKSGILIKGGEYLENAGKISVLALDKTGTLTEGKPRVTDVVALLPERELAGFAALADNPPEISGSVGRWSPAQQDVLYWAAVAEASSEHPLARSILAEAEPLREIPASELFETTTGRGIYAVYDGNQIGVGTPALMKQLTINVPPEADEALDALKSAGKTAVLVSLNGAVIGVLGIADTLRANAPAMIHGLNGQGLKVVMLTGDDERTARAIAAQAGISKVRAGLLPEDKLNAIRELQAGGHVVAMVGDGINDAPALAAADIGIAMGAAGTDIAIETADIALMADDLMKIPQAIRLSKATLNNIRQNVVIALLTVTVLLTGVLLREVHMAGGMLIHEVSVLVVILNGMRLLRL
ncbi:MAG: cation-translocating P-type ATPase [Anaerolineae bacterium]|nr:cation-translocating P-type ATPase [Anaerolineae bacterium]